MKKRSVMIFVLGIVLLSFSVIAVNTYISREVFEEGENCAVSTTGGPPSAEYQKMFSVNGTDGINSSYCVMNETFNSSKSFIISSYLAFDAESCAEGYGYEQFQTIPSKVHKNSSDYVNRTVKLCVKKQSRSNETEMAKVNYRPFSLSVCPTGYGLIESFIDKTGKTIYHCGSGCGTNSNVSLNGCNYTSGARSISAGEFVREMLLVNMGVSIANCPASASCKCINGDSWICSSGAVAPTTTCVDSDNSPADGNLINSLQPSVFVKGNVSVILSDGITGYSLFDECGGSDGNYILERYCKSDGTPDTILSARCLNGCVDGACVDGPIVDIFGCRDEDRGNAFDKFGVCVGNDSKREEDRCVDKKLLQFSCGANGGCVGDGTSECPRGTECQNGICATPTAFDCENPIITIAKANENGDAFCARMYGNSGATCDDSVVPRIVDNVGCEGPRDITCDTKSNRDVRVEVACCIPATDTSAKSDSATATPECKREVIHLGRLFGAKTNPNLACKMEYGEEYSCNNDVPPACEGWDLIGQLFNMGRCSNPSCDGGYAGVNVWVSCCKSASAENGGTDSPSVSNRNVKIQVLDKNNYQPIVGASVTIKRNGVIVGSGNALTVSGGVTPDIWSLNVGGNYEVNAVNGAVAGQSITQTIDVTVGTDIQIFIISI